jgi:hypothetical protein
VERTLQRAHRALNAEEIASAEFTGHEMTLERALEYALETAADTSLALAH